MNRRLKSLIIYSLILLFLFAAGVVLKNIFLFQIKKRIEPALNYSHLRLNLFPPSLVIEDVRTVSSSPFFSAQKIVIRISYVALLTKEKPLDVFIEQPVLRIYEVLSGPGGKKSFLPLTLPFTINKGLLRGGEIYVWGDENSFYSRGVKAYFQQKKEQFSFLAESEDSVFLLSSVSRELSGRVSLFAEGTGKEVHLRRIKIDTPDIIFKAKGSLTRPEDPELRLKTSLHITAPLIADIFDLPFTWDGKGGGEGELVRKQGKVTFRALLDSDDLTLNRIPLGNVQGRVALGEPGGDRVELVMQKRPLPREYMDILFRQGRVEGKARGFHLDPIINEFSLPWPVKSPVWGEFVLENGRLTIQAKFQDELLINPPARFAFQGDVRFDWDGKTDISFSSQKLQSSFGEIEVNGQVRIGKEFNISIRGEMKDIRQAREFTSLVLNQDFDFPEIRGRGYADVKILGRYYSPEVKTNFSLQPGGFGPFEVRSVDGMAEIAQGELSGIFKVNDPDVMGDIRLLSKPDGLDLNIRIDQGSLEKILPSLDIPFPLQGKASGSFEVSEKEGKLEVKGDFQSDSIRLPGLEAREAKGKLEWKNDELSFPEIQFNIYDGRVKGAASVDLKEERFDIDLTGEDIKLSTLYSRIGGTLSFGLKGKGVFGQDAARGKFRVKDLHTNPFEMAQASGDVELNVFQKNLNVRLEGNLEPGPNDFTFSFNYPFQEKTFTVDLKGKFTNMDLLLPWKGAKGEINYLAEINGSADSPQISGVVDFKGPVFPFPGFAHAFRDYKGLVFIQNNRASLRSFQAKLGGGDVFGVGEIRLGQGGLELIDVRMEGKDLLLSPLERIRVLTDGSLRLVKDSTRFALEGDFFIKRLFWRRELSEKLAFSSVPFLGEPKEPGLFDSLSLDVRLRAEDEAFLDNSLGKVKARFDLRVTGNVNSPIVMGEIEGLDGEVYFQDRKFKVLRARLSLFNPAMIEPYLDFRGETFLKDYRVTFSLTGFLDRLRPEFSSSPPLPPEDVLALLTLGESFKRTYSYDTSTQLSTGSLLSFQIAEEVKKRAEKLFALDRFRIDPFVLGASTEMTARLTVGKKISRNVILLYSTNISTQREDIIRFEWEFSENFSLVGMRDERGQFSLDAKIRKRF
ncbi:MAG: translocation/assembly module TamB domain-containing protein [Candidatus Aminicenantales bacterium]